MFNDDAMNYNEYYAQQVGGALPYFTGSRVQRGHGFGTLLGGLLRTVAPLIKRGALALGNRALKTGTQIAGDVLSGQNIRIAAKRRVKIAGNELLQIYSLHLLVNVWNELHRKNVRNDEPEPRPKDAYRARTCFPSLAFIHQQSCEGVKSKLDLFAVPPTQTSIDEGQWIEHQPMTSLDSGGPIEFVVPGTGDAYIDLANTYLFVRAKIIRGVGTNLADDTPVAPINNWLHSLFSQVDVYLNDTLVTPSSNTYPFRAYVETLLSYGAEAKKTQLTSQLWYKDTAGHMDATQENGGNAGLARRRHIVGSRVVEMMGRLHVDLFMQDRFLLNGVTVRVRLVRSKDTFSLMAGGANPDYKVCIVDAVLFVRKAVLSPTVQIAHIQALTKGTAKYPLRPVDCKVYSIAQGAMSHTHENLFLGTLPKRIILWCVDNDAFNGTFEKNPFHAKNNAVNFLAIYVDGRQVSAKPLQPNFETGHYIRSYVNLFSATGKHAQDEGNELTRDDFGNGYTFFGFDLTPDACDGGCLHLVQKGNLRIEIHFAEALAQTVSVIVYAEFEAVLEIDKGRNIIYNHP